MMGSAVFGAMVVIRTDVAPPNPPWPLVLGTWTFMNSTRAAYKLMNESKYEEGKRIALDGLETGGNYCELHPWECDWTVGYGGSPNELGETTLDAMVMWAKTREVGAVGYMKNIKKAISVARKVMEETYHTLLIGGEATQFAVEMGFVKEDLSTDRTRTMLKNWIANGRQPNFWVGKHNYSSNEVQSKLMRKRDNGEIERKKPDFGRWNHDTLGMIAIDKNGDVACGVTSNGATWKIPGRVGDAPIVGAGAWCDNDVGAAMETGDGDVMMRFLPSVRVVDLMRMGVPPQRACQSLINDILRFYPNATGAIVAANKRGDFGAAYMGNLPNGFPFTVQHKLMKDARQIWVKNP
eukprot:TRINITY_DN5619_c0_g2_i2.p1 TRINITY_DN5619_c0_g2~~TRINITY_DN5619_c0_g2_i2.p1  ORF type:complete len:351 (-),score=115.13 TRINITY_DN5619_c0_g2_i2:2-1054(-)